MRFLMLVLMMTICVSVYAVELYVAPDGNDSNPGTKTQPFATLEAARDAIRKFKSAGPLSEPVQVRIADGVYVRTTPFLLTSADSGSEQAPIRYEAQEGATPSFIGGRNIEGWQQEEDGIWTAQIPDVASGDWYFEQLFIDGHRAIRAREPDEFYFYMKSVQEKVLEEKEDGRVPLRAEQTVGLPDGLLEETLARVPETALNDVNMLVYHKWDNTRRRIHALMQDTESIMTRGTGMKPWNPWKPKTRFHFENYRAALDTPGEWFLDRDGTLYYMPLPNEDMTQAKVVAPVVDKFLVIKGESANNDYVEYVTLTGLTFEYGQWITPPEGFEAQQAAASIEGVVQIDGARNIVIENCAFGHFGTYGVWFRQGCRDCVLRHCHVYDAGAGGVRIGECALQENAALQTSHIVVDNNILRHGGRIFPCAVGAWIGQSGDNQLTHNEIADFFYTGISVGWRWGYSDSLAKRNDIGFNNVHHIGWGVLSDMGGIYTLGPSEGTTVHDNVFHDIYAYSYGGWGLYTDEGSTGIVFSNNLVYNTKTGGFHQHYGKENVIRNNILAFAELHQLQATRVEEHLSFTLENNIIYYDTGKVLAGPWDKVRFNSSKNCFWQVDGKTPSFLGKSLEEWQTMGHEKESIVADPKFADPATGKYTLASNSPALMIGFKPFDYSRAGVYGDDSWKAKATDVTYPELEITPEQHSE